MKCLFIRALLYFLVSNQIQMAIYMTYTILSINSYDRNTRRKK